jgi:hypothetical protein
MLGRERLFVCWLDQAAGWPTRQELIPATGRPTEPAVSSAAAL